MDIRKVILLVTRPEGLVLRGSRWPLGGIGVVAAVALAGCARLPQAPQIPETTVAARWQEPAPTGPATPLNLERWWDRLEDPVLSDLVRQAERVDAPLSAAVARVEQARAERVAAGAVLVPQLSGGETVQRGRAVPSGPVTNTRQNGFQAAWEIDLFGAAQATRDASRSRLLGARAAADALKVSLAAEVALGYAGLRACEALVRQAQVETDSRQQTLRVSETAFRSGLVAAIDLASARAGAARARAQVVSQQAQCDRQVKALVAATALDEPSLRERLAPAQARVPQPARFAVTQLPAAVLNQRPDVLEAAQAVAAAAAEQKAADARQWPTVRLSGNLGDLRVSTSAGSTSGRVWTVGPLEVTFPIFDAGQRKANLAAARATFDASVSSYQARVRRAVQEVEQAMVDLGSADAQQADTALAAREFAAAFSVAQTRYEKGLSSLFELEEARRNASLAEVTRLQLELAHFQAWVALCRALGGGWTPPTDPNQEPA
jgi:outer membrane protein, multidrug efflux system